MKHNFKISWKRQNIRFLQIMVKSSLYGSKRIDVPYALLFFKLCIFPRGGGCSLILGVQFIREGQILGLQNLHFTHGPNVGCAFAHPAHPAPSPLFLEALANTPGSGQFRCFLSMIYDFSSFFILSMKNERQIQRNERGLMKND